MWSMIAVAWATSVPVTGVLLDGSGSAISGPREVTFSLSASGSGLPEVVWTGTRTVDVIDGAFSAWLELDTNAEAYVASEDPLSLQVRIADGAWSAPVAIGWTPRAAYARVAETARALDGVLDDANLPANVARTDRATTFTAALGGTTGTFSGAVQAASFSGSGAGLTAIPQAAVTNLSATLASYLPLAGGALTGGLSGTTGAFSGAVNAASFSGSGAGLTGIPQAAVTNLSATLASYLPLAGGTLTGGLSGTTGAFSGAVSASTLNVTTSSGAEGGGTFTSTGNLGVTLRGGASLHQFFRFFEGSTARWEVGNASADANKFYFNPTAGAGTTGAAMVVQPNGNVGVGTITPSHNLQVAGALRVGNTVLNAWAGRIPLAASYTTDPLHIRTNWTCGVTDTVMYNIEFKGHNFLRAEEINVVSTGYLYGVNGLTHERNATISGGTVVDAYCASAGKGNRLTFRVSAPLSSGQMFHASDIVLNLIGGTSTYQATAANTFQVVEVVHSAANL